MTNAHLLTAPEVAQRLGVGIRTVQKWAGKLLPGTKHGRDWYFRDEDVAAFVRPVMGRPRKEK